MDIAHACEVDVTLNRTRRTATLLAGCRLALIAVAVLLGAEAGAQSTSDYAYWLDEFSITNVQNVPADTMVIGETSSQERHTITTTTNRIVGTTVTFQPGGSKKIKWSFSPGHDLKSLFNTATPPSLATPCERRAFAQEIFDRTVSADSLDAFPTAAEATPTSTGGYVVWSQDLEGPMNVPEETASAIIAMMWAARELFTLTDDSTGQCTPLTGNQMKVVPTPASILQKSPASTAFPDGWNLSEVVTGGASDNYVAFLKLDQTLSADDQTALGQNMIDLLSFLHLATAEGVPLIDGILAQQYSSQGCTTDPNTGCLINCTHLNCQALPGRLSDDTPPFYDTTMPYAIQSAVSCPAQLYLDPPTDCSTATRPWPSNYRGSLPMKAGIYWAGTTVDPSFDPSQYLTPTLVAIGGCESDLDENGTVDARDLTLLLGHWGTGSGDINGDGTTDAGDLNMLLTNWNSVCEVSDSSGWINVLIAENAPPAGDADQQAYVDKIQKLAPGLEQIHLRYPAGASDDATHQMFATLIGKFRAAFGASLMIGFHPDNSNSSCTDWGCTQGDCAPTSAATWQCVLSNSIEAMNAINQLVDSAQSGNGFTIFSIEQSYVEDVGSSLAEIKQCLAGDASALPGVTPAQPPVRFGNVLGSYGGPDLYGADGYDYTYPQYYNLGKRLTEAADVLLQGASPYFPVASAQACLDGATRSIEVVDVDSNGAYPAPKIPCFDQNLVQNVYTTTSDGSSGADPVLASAYVAYLMTQYPPISNTVELGGSEVFITFSGEPAMLGSPGWTLDKIDQFHAQLESNFASLKAQVPSLFPTGGTDPDSIKYAIWNFDQMLDAISLP